MGDIRVLSEQDVRKVAKLARLAISEEQVHQYRGQLAAVLGYMDRLREIDTSGVEPMSHPTDQTNRLDEDVAPAAGERRTTLSTDVLMGMAPDKMEPFVKVPPVIGEGAA